MRRYLFLLSFIFIGDLWATTMTFDDFSASGSQRWRYVSDQVMGGVSVGNLYFIQDEQESFAQLTGQVSTENNGGFIQFRTDVKKIHHDFEGIYVKVKGNNEAYFVHLRTRGTLMPWQYYQSEFFAADQWQIIKLPISSFAPSSKWLKKSVAISSIRSIGLVAFGRDHNANLKVAEIGFY